MSDIKRSRHLSKDGFESFLASGVPYNIPIDGSPDLILFIRPDRSEVGLRADPVNLGRSQRRYPNGIALRSVYAGGRAYTEVVIGDAALFVEGFAILCAIADRIQLDQMSLLAAVEITIRNLRSLISASSPSLTREDEIGLLGELLVVDSLLTTLSQEDALAAWRASADRPAEHDFGLAKLDLEVKTTSTESRVHWISSATQLMPSKDRDLWLLSHQLTSAGSNYGKTLRDVAEQIRSGFTGVEVRSRYESILRRRGWPWADADLGRWNFRFPSETYSVEGSFPRITLDVVGDAAVDTGGLRSLSYQVDLTNYSSEQEPSAELCHLLANLGEL
jgi:hypothetical protein